MAEAILLQCIGDALRGDDGAGPLLADLLEQQSLPENVRISRHWGEGTELMQEWAGAAWVIMVDAARAEGRAGRLHHFDLQRQTVPERLACFSSHAFGPVQAVEMGRSLGRLPKRIELYALEGHRFGLGEQMSNEMRQAVEQLRQRLPALLPVD